MRKRKYTIYRIPSPWNCATLIIKHYSDGHYYVNEELPIFYETKGYLLSSRFSRTSKNKIKEMLNID